MSSIKAIALAKVVGGGGGGGEITLETLNVDANATYNAPSGKAYKKVIAAVPNSYAAGDEGKVVSGGALAAQTTKQITANGTVDTTTNNVVEVAVQPVTEVLSVTENGTYTPGIGKDGFSSVTVNVSGGGGMPYAKLTSNFVFADLGLTWNNSGEEAAA